MNEYLETVGLGEAGVANVAFVRFLAGVDAQVALEFEGVGRGVGAVRTLVGPLARVATHVALEFG